MPTIRLPTHEDLAAITSRDLSPMKRVPHLYIALRHLIPAEADPDAMKAWGVACLPSLADYVRLYPDSLVAPHDMGDRASRADLIYHGAEPAADFVPRE